VIVAVFGPYENRNLSEPIIASHDEMIWWMMLSDTGMGPMRMRIHIFSIFL